LSILNLDTLDKYIVVLKNQLTELLCHEIMPITKGTRYSIITWFN